MVVTTTHGAEELEVEVLKSSEVEVTTVARLFGNLDAAKLK